MRWFLIFLISASLKANAGLLIGAFGGGAADTDDGIEQLKGSANGVKAGWRWNWIALEAQSVSYDLKTGTGQAENYYIEKGEISGNVFDFVLRFYPFRFLSLFGGVTEMSTVSDIELTNVNGNSGETLSREGETFSSGTLFGAGVHVPIGAGFELYGEYVVRSWKYLTDDLGGTDVPNLKINEWHAGLTWTWGGGGSKKPKSQPKTETLAW